MRTKRRAVVDLALGSLGVTLCIAVACGGSEFSGSGLGPGGSAGWAAEEGGQAGSEEVAGAVGTGREAGGAGHGIGGSGGEGGEGGSFADFDCAARNGVWFQEHCYVDATLESLHQVDAAAACEGLAEGTRNRSELLRLDSLEEQAFIIEQFLTETSDAWLGLTCSSRKHPELTDCYCTSCEDAQLLEKRAAWTWPDGSSSDFGWVGINPDGQGRCSALAFNHSNEKWGWVDRVCLSTSHQIQSYPVHDYRVLCEID